MSLATGRSWLHRSLAMLESHRNGIGMLAVAVVLALTGFALHHLLRTMRLTDVAAAVSALPAGTLAASLALTAASYMTLIGYDLSALRYVGQRMPLRTVALASFCGYAIGNTVGFSLLTGGSVRFRIYSAAGLRADDIGRVALFCVIAFGFGICAVSGLGALMRPELLAPIFAVPVSVLQGLGLALVASVGGFFLLCGRRRELRLRGVTLPLPSVRLTVAQLCISAVDLCFASAALYVLLPDGLGLTYFAFLPLYCVAIIAGISSHVPGGLGVFEAVVLYSLGDQADKTALVGALVVYRFIYFVVPLITAGVVLALGELYRQLPTTRAAFSRVLDLPGSMVPTAASLLSVMAGVLLLASAVTPMQEARAAVLPSLLPLPVVEAAHVLATVVASALICLAPALQCRVNAAYRLVFAGLAVGAAASLAKGLDYEPALALTCIGVLLLPYRREFYRHTSILNQPFTLGWVLVIASILGGAAWLMLFAYKHLGYGPGRWFEFAFDADASRSLRGMVAAVVAVIAFAAIRLLRTTTRNDLPTAPTPDQFTHALTIARGQGRADAMLVAMMDKELLFSASGESFLMFGRRSASWIALFDPIGRDEERGELIWQFREVCDRKRVRAAFYQIRAEHLSLYLDAGMNLTKLGEEARVHVNAFTLDGNAGSTLQDAMDRARREQISFRMLAPGQTEAALTEMASVSNAWLAHFGKPDAAFSMGAFSAAYIAQFDVAAAFHRGQMIAFVSVLRTDLTQEAVIDLMRCRPGAPASTMPFLLTSLILQLQSEGVRCLSLGMALLSGLEQRRLTRLWRRIGAPVYEHGERYYSFRADRKFKQAFTPVWEPRYLASPGGVDPAAVLADAASLMAGGPARNGPTRDGLGAIAAGSARGP